MSDTPEHDDKPPSEQQDLFERLTRLRAAQPEQLVPKERAAEPSKQPDFFELDIPLLEFAFKDDMESMEAPVYSLSTKKDTKVLEWESQDGQKRITVSPSAEVGRATIFDKDVLIYATSQLVAAQKAGKPISRTVRFSVGDFLFATDRVTGGGGSDDYERFYAAMKRLRGTSITVVDKGKSLRWAKGFGLIDSWEIIDRADRQGRARMVKVECTLSEWLYEAINHKQILTISREYFKLRRPIERRLYEVARKHCGKQPEFRISLEALREKCGVLDALRNFRMKVREMAETQPLPEYLIKIDNRDTVTFIPRTYRLSGS